MSISSEISRISQNVADSLEQVALKGVTVPAGSNSDDLPDLIAQITGGGSGGIVISDTTDAAGGTVRTITAVEIAGTKSITENGTGIDVASYESVDVNVPGYDMPKFVITINTSTMQPTSVTCDKTFSEVNDYTQAGKWYSVVDLDYGGSEPMELCGALYTNYSGQTLVSIDCYVEFQIEGVAQYKITYSANGTLSAEFMPIPDNDSTDLTASNLTVTAPAGYYHENATKTLTDQNLIASNIKKNVSIFGVTGTYEGGGGASNIVIGSFKGTTAGAAMNVTIPYSGSGYPVFGMIYPKNGTNKSGDPFATLIQNQAEVTFDFVKQDPTTTPDFTSSTADENKYSAAITFKYSTSNPLAYASGKSESLQLCTRHSATATYANCVRFTSSTNMSIYIADTTYGFANGIEYEYMIRYSS